MENIKSLTLAKWFTVMQTINQELNEIFADATTESPTMAIRVDNYNNGIHFVVDWDWRGDTIASIAPMYNTVILVDGDVEYDHSQHKIKKISMTWQFTKDSEMLMATVMDFDKNEFYFMECYREEIWEDCSSKESIVDLFNKGKLTYDKLCEYPYSGIILVKSNITLSMKDIKFKAMWKKDSDLNGVGVPQNAESDKELLFEDLYSEIYPKIKHLEIRNESDMMNLSSGTELDYINDAAEYGLNKITYVATPKGVFFLYLRQEELEVLLSQAQKMDLVKKYEELRAFVEGIKGCLRAQGDDYIGKLGSYNDIEYTINYVFKDVWYETDWCRHCQSFSYSITDGVNELVFERVNGGLANFDVNPTGDESENIVDGMLFTMNKDRKSYSLSEYAIKSQNDEINLVIPATYKNKPVTKIADNAITGAKIANGAITTYKIDTSAVTTDRIANDAITDYKIATGAVTTDKIADNNVITAKIADSAVTENKIADSAVTADKIATDSITTNKIKDNSISFSKLNDDLKLAALNITCGTDPMNEGDYLETGRIYIQYDENE